MGYEKESKGLGSVLLAVYAASRLFYLVAGALLARVVPVASFQRMTFDVPFGTMNLWPRWDGEHYVALAAGGYLQPPDNTSPAFFSLYPLLISWSAFQLLAARPLPGRHFAVRLPVGTFRIVREATGGNEPRLPR